MASMNRYLLLTAGLALAVFAAALGFALSGASTNSASPTEPAPPVGTSTSSDNPPDEPADGRYFGFVKSVDFATSPATVVVDLADLLDGETANRAAADRGYPVPVDNDHFIVNDDLALRTLTLSPQVRILLVDWKRCCGLKSVSRQKFQASFGQPMYSDLHPRGEFSQYWLEVENGVVAEIDEQYRP
jgi:hypothetical protein